MCNCPFHTESKPSFGIQSKYPYTYNCFSCGVSGTLTQLIQHVFDFHSELDAIKYLVRNFLATTVSSREPIDVESLLQGRGKSTKHKQLEQELSEFVTKRHPYMKQRGLHEKTLMTYEVGYDADLRAIAMPVRTLKGDLRFIKRRFVDQKGFLNEKGIYKKDIVYGLYNIVKALGKVHTIYLVESETDVLSCYGGGLLAGALMGRILFAEQITELLRAGVTTINLFLDNDWHGLQASKDAYDKLIKTPIKVNMVKYPHKALGFTTMDEDEVSYKDANDLLRSNQLANIGLIPFENIEINWKNVKLKTLN